MSNRVDVIVTRAKSGGPTTRTVGSKSREIFSMLCESEKFFGGREATTGNTSAVRRLPAFDCCAVVWYSCSKADREHLDKPHRRAASIIEGYTV